MALLASTLLVVVASTGIGMLAAGTTVAGVDGGDAAATDTQVNPEEVESEGNLSAVERQLAARAAQRIRSGAVEVSEGDAERARAALGDEEFEKLVDQYGDVANQTGGERRARTVRRIQRLQLRYTEQVARYRTAYSQYVVVKRSAASGTASDAEARRLARHMGTIARNVNDTATRLLDRYRALPDNESADARNATAAIRDTRADILRTQEAVRRAEFVPTRVQVTSSTETISLTRPLRVSGRLTTANGTAVANEPITVHVVEANRSVTTTTDETGAFAFSYRPTTLPRNTTELTLRYEAAAETAYAGNRTSIDVVVEQTVPTVELYRQLGTVAYNDTLTVTGRVTASGTGIADAPYVLTIGTERVVRGETDERGRFVVRERISPQLDTGQRRIEVVFPFGNRTLATVSASTNVTVTSQPTRISLSTGSTGERVVRVSGRLTTASGEAVRGAPVRLRVASTSFGSVTTDREGRFSTTVTVPKRAVGSGLLSRKDRVTVEAIYENGGTLDSARQVSSVTVTEPVPWLPIGVGVGALVLLGGGYLLYSRAPWRGGASAGSGGTGGASGSAAPGALDVGAVGTDALLSAAREQLSSGRSNVAVALGYEALRRRLASEAAVDGERARTHWEFYRACQEHGVDEEVVETLARATELYERAAFAGETIDAETARTGLERMASVMEAERKSAGG